MSYRRRLLAAPPGLADPNFALSVVLVLEHDHAGALGIVLNRPSQMPLPESLAGWDVLACEPRVLFVGGPVQPEVVLLVGRSDGAAPDADVPAPLPPGFALVDPTQQPHSSPIRDVRAFAGYAGWGAGQLEAEVAAGGWFVVDAEPQDLLTAEPESLWLRVLRRQGGVFSTVTADPRAN